MRTTDKYVFFWDGVYSQWVYAPMEVDGTIYSSCEQYMMQQKALLFGDKTAAKDIMATNDPSVQKQIGRKVKNFNRDVWDQHCMGIVFKGNYAKFNQNPHLEKELRLTYDRIIVEASPYDKIWGIGMHQDEEGIEDPANWKGLNLLGHCIMHVRSVIRMESAGLI